MAQYQIQTTDKFSKADAELTGATLIENKPQILSALVEASDPDYATKVRGGIWSPNILGAVREDLLVVTNKMVR